MKRLSLRSLTGRWLTRSLAIGLLWAAGQMGPLHAAPYAPPHLYIGPEAILTLEIVNANNVILNVINLSDYVLVFEPKNLICKSKSGKTSIGQVIDMPETDTRGHTWKYRAKLTILPKTSQGFTVRGAFQELDALESILIKFGGRRFYLVSVLQTEFNALAEKIGNIDLKASDILKNFADLQIPTMGKLRFPTGPESSEDDTRGLITPEGINPPRIIVKTAVQATEAARKAGVRGPVQITGLVTRDGEFTDVKVSKGVGYGLDERALESVKNSWRFLPATKEGEVADATVTLRVEFN